MYRGFPGGYVVKNPSASSGDTGSIPGLVGSPRGGNDNPLQYFCLGNPMDRGAWWDYSPQGTEELDMPERLNNNSNNSKHTEREPLPASVLNFSRGLNGSSFLSSVFFLILAL